ncbi:uncharacterized protein TNCV_4393031 [Trichonephila clavipes]|nr:uncharacterized protein TNCV_4393031 [Trichonephila clavipes]
MPAGQVPPRASSMVAVDRNGNSYSFSRHLRGSVGFKVLEWTQSFAPIEIHRQLCQVDGPNIMMPKNLSPEYKIQRFGAALAFLQQYQDDVDETCTSHFTPETMQQSTHWWHSGSPVRTKFKQMLSVLKVMCTVFRDRKGILLIDFLPRGERVNADPYSETLWKLRRAIQNKRRGMLTYCSSDLPPSDFHVFLYLKKFLSSGKRFGNDEELKTSVRRWFHSQAAEFYDRGIQKLIPRFKKCLNSGSGYYMLSK